MLKLKSIFIRANIAKVAEIWLFTGGLLCVFFSNFVKIPRVGAGTSGIEILLTIKQLK